MSLRGSVPTYVGRFKHNKRRKREKYFRTWFSVSRNVLDLTQMLKRSKNCDFYFYRNTQKVSAQIISRFLTAKNEQKSIFLKSPFLLIFCHNFSPSKCRFCRSLITLPNDFNWLLFERQNKGFFLAAANILFYFALQGGARARINFKQLKFQPKSFRQNSNTHFEWFIKILAK